MKKRQLKNLSFNKDTLANLSNLNGGFVQCSTPPITQDFDGNKSCRNASCYDNCNQTLLPGDGGTAC